MDKLEAAIQQAVKPAPYLQYAVAAAEWVIIKNVPFPMASDRYWRVYVNPDLCESLSVNEMAWIVLHEVGGHILRGHCQHTKDDQQRANMAQDLEIESWEWPGPATRPTGALSGLHPDKFGLPVGEVWEFYYDQLPSQSAMEHDCGSCSGGEPRDWEKGEKDASIKPGSIKEKLIQKKTADAISKAAGDIPGGLEVWAGQQAEPMKVRWQDTLRSSLSSITSCGLVDKLGPAKEKFGMLSAKWRALPQKVAVIADTSGSMDGLAGKVLGSVWDIARRSGEVHVCWTDIDFVWEKAIFKKQMKPRGGGGTDLRPAILDARKKDFDAIIIITDCETPWPEPCAKSIVLPLEGQPPKDWRTINVITECTGG